jgi:nicotinamidase/pyrazinamidase
MVHFSLRESALIVVDAQQGFSNLCPNELPIPGALQIVPLVNELLKLPWSAVHATQDWHPPDHCSFLGRRDNLYPSHCIQGTAGADFLPGLCTQYFHAIWRKGFESDREAYAVTAQHPEFGNFLAKSGIGKAFICGLATNVCCFFTARDLRQTGLEAFIVEDASAGIDLPPANLYQAKAKEEGLALGIRYVSTREVLGGQAV